MIESFTDQNLEVRVAVPLIDITLMTTIHNNNIILMRKIPSRF